MFSKINNKKSEELQTVPTDEQIAITKAQDNSLLLLANPIIPITFLDYDNLDQQHMIGTIMCLPTEIQSINNVDVARNISLYSILKDDQLVRLHYTQTMIQVEQVVELIHSVVIQNFTNFVNSSNYLPLFLSNVGVSAELRRPLEDIRKELWYELYRDLRFILSSDNHIDMIKRPFKDIHATLSDHCALKNCDVKGNLNQKHMERMIATMNSVSKQVLEIISIPVCKVVNDFVEKYTPKQGKEIIDSINNTFDLNENLKTLNDLRSFVNEGLMLELRYLLLGPIKTNIDHICDNYYMTYYSIYRDLYHYKKENDINDDKIETDF